MPLIGLSALSLAAAIAGLTAWWSLSDTTERTVNVAIALVLTANLALSVSIGITRTAETPWLRIGIIALGFALSCGLSALL
jgi:uncharacterized membrane protein YgaE (UPF0421/DUF939 family)